MPLKFTIAKLEEVAEGVRNLYRQEGEKYVLDVEGAVARERLDEFRNNNIQLQQQLDKLKDVDPVKYRELVDIQRKIQEKELIDKGELDKVVELRTAAMRDELTSRATKAERELAQANSQLSTLMIDSTVKAEALKLGVAPTALEDVVLRARAIYVMENGKAVPKTAEGQVRYGKDGSTPMPIGEWLTTLKTDAPHLFATSQGSGAGGGRGAGTVDMSKLTPAQKISMGLSQSGLMKDLPGTA